MSSGSADASRGEILRSDQPATPADIVTANGASANSALDVVLAATAEQAPSADDRLQWLLAEKPLADDLRARGARGILDKLLHE